MKDSRPLSKPPGNQCSTIPGRRSFSPSSPAMRRPRAFSSICGSQPLGRRDGAARAALGRILADDILATVDVPASTAPMSTASRWRRRIRSARWKKRRAALQLNDEVLSPGIAPRHTVTAGHATMIATGGMVPRGADAVVMVEHTEVGADGRRSSRARRRPGRKRQLRGHRHREGRDGAARRSALTSREIGVLAAVGLARGPRLSQPHVAILSTGNEIVAPGHSAPARRRLRLERGDHRRRGRRAGRRGGPARIIPDNDEALAEALAPSAANAISSCSPAEPPRERATSRIAS